MQIEDVTVEKHEDFGGGYRLLVFSAPGIASETVPGQFVHIRVPGLYESDLRRPFSIYHAGDGQVRVLYKAVGTGTNAMLKVAVGDTLSVIGPLGRGFPSDHGDTFPLFIAGGYGVAPLSFLAQVMPCKGVAFLGAQTASDIFCVADFERAGWEVKVATEDGSMGSKGLVTGVLDDFVESYGDPTGGTDKAALEYYGCGPGGMLKAVGDRALAQGCQGWLSLDKHMGCGVGACLACVQKVRNADGDVSWARGCREGPVFDAREVVWGDNA
jgi:dihydroorotate dehydrogenase electron transfer subunit